MDDRETFQGILGIIHFQLEQSLFVPRREGAEVGDDGLGVGVIHVVGVHGRADGLGVGADSFFEDVDGVGIGVAGEAGDGGGVLGPVFSGMYGSDPDGGALQPPGVIEITLGISRRVALLAFGDFFD